MGLFDFIRGELIDIIQWLDDSSDTMVYRFERKDNEIKYGAKLVVREGQVAVFVNEGEAQRHVDQVLFEPADAFEPGTYTLETKNVPILSKLKGWKYGFESPFKAEVYFFNTTRFTNQKWGTPNPIMLRDPEFGPVRLRAFGTYSLKIKDAPKFLKEIVGTKGRFQIDGIADQLRSNIVTRFTDVLGENRIPVLDLAANYDELGKFVMSRIGGEFEEYGLQLTQLLINNISLPPAVEEALDKRSSMGIIGNLGQYAQYQAAEAMTKAAENPNGMAGAGVGMGAGFAMAEQMRTMFNQPTPQAAPPVAPPPLPTAVSYHVAQGGQTGGPFDLNALRLQVQNGQLQRDTLVWKQGMAQWTAAAQVPDLAPLFAALPPPLPPV